MSKQVRNRQRQQKELQLLEASLARYDLMDPDEVDSEEYQRLLDRLVKLREEFAHDRLV